MYNHQEVEKKWNDFWEKSKIFKKSVEERPKEKQFVFYDGPPFATGVPHYGNILGLTSKDVFPRFWTMKGFRCERQWGWDCHGLPIEKIAEKALGIKEKKEIKEMGVDKFNEFCKSQVLDFVAEWKKTVTRMGKWIDFDNAYKTMDQSYMETIWHLLKKLYAEKYLYEGKKVLLYCPKCETPLANAEIDMDNSYREITEKTVTAKFKAKDEKNTFYLAWSTTPWTLIGNVALAINPDLVYAKIKVNDEYYILAKNRLTEIKEAYGEVETFKGKELLKKEYEPLYHQPSEKKGHYLINGGGEVSADEGTGIVHMALYGEFDYQMIKKYDLPVIQHIGPHGKVESGPEEWGGTWFKDADGKVLEDLEKRNLLYASENYTHAYPFCYRCNTPLFYNALDSWFIDIQRIKKQLIKHNKQINWYPSNLKEGRFLHILETAPDWNISRNRFWATALPIWKCTRKSCDHVEVIGSIKELQGKAERNVHDNIDLHKHVMDKVKLKCERCKGTMTRIPEVLDCWVESGSMPFAAKHYPFENKEWFKDNYPADFVSEYIPQVRTWFYYMHVLGVLTFDQAPFRNIVTTGTLLAADGAKMSKSKQNYPDPNDIFDKYGADTLRFYLMGSTLMKGQDSCFNELSIKEIYRKVIMILWNVKLFYGLFEQKNKEVNKPHTNNLLDKWIVSYSNSFTRDVTNALEAYDTVTACSRIQAFVEDLSTWYVRRSRERFKDADKKVSQEAVETLAYILYRLAKVMAPLAPFIAEEVHHTFSHNKKLPTSVHLDTWPEVNETLILKHVEEDMIKTREIVSRILELREKEKIPIRQPLNEATIAGATLEEGYLAIIADEVNVKKVKLTKGEKFEVKLDIKLTPALEAEGFAREVSRKVQALRKKAGLKMEDRITLTLAAEHDISSFVDEMKQKVGAKDLKLLKPGNKQVSGKYTAEEKIKGKAFHIAFDLI